MTWADEQHELAQGESTALRFEISGDGQEWHRLQERIFSIFDSITQRIAESARTSPEASQEVSEAAKDLSTIALRWAQAKIEKPSLENEKLKAEIASEFAEAKRRYAEAAKFEAEARKLDVETRNAQLVADLDHLERLMRLASTMSHFTFQRIGGNGHLLIGPSPEQLGEPAGDDSLPK